MSTTNRERNALLGLLAVRSGLIERRQLADAMAAWGNDPSQPLERLLVSRQVLGEMHCRLLEELVAEKIRRHRLDVRACLREICAEAPELAEIGRELVPGLSDDAPVSPEIAPTLDAMSLPLAGAAGAGRTGDGGREARAGGRFRILERHAEGGLGRVMRARDEELGRTVAVKEIKPEQADNPVSQERFVLEAEITGGLEHPGIVPVYSLGRYDDGRPYYAMRFIRGENLNQAIAGFHQRDSLPRDDGQRLLELHQLLRRFIDTCNAVRYAHSRGVLHRDIKPANVMLGRFGETLVVDWGVAKLIGHSEAATDLGEPELRPASGSGSHATLAGSAVGTPAFMSPEQARGDLEHLGTASDVYSLGATLYCLLTGRAPFANRRDALQLVKRGDFPPPRALDSRIPKPLEAVCLKAMAMQPEDRYASVGELVADLERWMADEPVFVHRETTSERVARWMRRHRAWVQAGGAALIAVAAVSLAAAVLIARAWRNESEARRVATQAEQDAVEAKQEAVQRFGQAREAVDKWLTGAGDVLAYFPGTGEARKRLLEQAAEDYEQFARRHSDDLDLEIERGRTYLRLGHLRRQLRDARRAQEAYGAAEALFRELHSRHPENVVCAAELANCWTDRAVVLMELGKIAPADELFRTATGRLTEFVAREPSAWQTREALAEALLNHAALLWKADKPQEAEDALRRSVSQLGAIPAEDAGGGLRRRETLARARGLLGDVLVEVGRYEEAAREINEALRVSGALVDMEPHHPQYRDTRAAASVSLAIVLGVLGRQQEQVGEYERALSDYAYLEQLLPGDSPFPEYLSITRIDLGGLLYKWGRVEEAEQQLLEAQQVLNRLVVDHPDLPNYRDYWVLCHDMHGEMLRDRGRLQEARSKFEEAIKVAERLVQPEGDEATGAVAAYAERLALCQSHLGQVLRLLGEHEAAKEAFQAAVATLSARQPLLPDSQDRLAFIYHHWAILLEQQGKHEDAQRTMDQARTIWEQLAAAEEAAPEHRFHWARLLADCPLPRFRNPDQALTVARRLTEEVAGNAEYWNILGLAQYRRGDWQAAAESLQRAIQARPAEHALDAFILAMVRWQLDDRDEAVQLYRRGSEWMEQTLPYDERLVRTRDEAKTLLGAAAE